jgi:hypothetical protein
MMLPKSHLVIFVIPNDIWYYTLNDLHLCHWHIWRLILPRIRQTNMSLAFATLYLSEMTLAFMAFPNAYSYGVLDPSKPLGAANLHKVSWESRMDLPLHLGCGRLIGSQCLYGLKEDVNNLSSWGSHICYWYHDNYIWIPIFIVLFVVRNSKF